MSFTCGIIKCFAEWVHLESAALSGTFYISLALAHCHPDAESCHEEKASYLTSPFWAQGEIPPSQAKNGKVGSAKTPKLWRGQQVRKPIYCMHLQESMHIFWSMHVTLTMISQNACLYAYTTWGTFRCVYVWKCLMVFLELSAICCKSDFCVPFSKCNPCVVAFWLC